MTNKRIILLVVLVLAVAGVAYAFQANPERKATDFKLDTARVDRGPIVAKVTATGTLSALVTVQVGSQVSGRISLLAVDFNSSVTKGQVIAKLDPQLFDAALEQARANASAARANLKRTKVQQQEAERQYERSKMLAERKLIATADLDTAESARDVAIAQVEASAGAVSQAEAALNQAQVNLGYTTIVSPINGVVISRSVDVGQTVAASLQAPTLFVIAEDLRKMQVDTSVSEADIGKLQPGMSATFVVDAFPGKKFNGTIRQIRNAAQTVQNVVTYDAVIDVANEELELRPGMTANVSFIYASADDALRIPNSALRFRPPPQLTAAKEGGARGGAGGARGGAGGAGAGAGARGARTSSSGATAGALAERAKAKENTPLNVRTVWIDRAGTPEAVQIKTGISDGTLTEVLEGKLAEGDALIINASGGTTGTPGMGGPRGGGSFRMF